MSIDTGYELRVLTPQLGLAGVAALALSACLGAPPELGDTEQPAQPAPTIDPRRSLAITDVPVLARFPLERVLDQLIAGSGVSGLTSRDLFHQWWDVFNPGPGLGRGPHCDDSAGDSGPRLNGFPFTCRPTPAEGAQAACDPFTDPNSPCAYVPIGLFMRFDLAPQDGSHCGEYRIVYAKQTGRTDGTDRNLIIFEAAMRNPHFNQGIRGCRKLVQAWADLSLEPDIAARAAALEEIYFDGYHEFDPVVQWSNYGDNAYGAGQLRTNQFVQPVSPRVWSLREFKLRKVCAPTCTLWIEPVTDKVNPFGPLFAPGASGSIAAAFQAEFLDKIPGLAAPVLSGIGMSISDAFNSGQSQATGSTTESNYAANFGSEPSAFRTAIQERLTAVGSPLTPDELVARAQTLSCAGCHRFSNGATIGGDLVWPSSLGFTHVSERSADLDVVAGVTRFRLSDALTTTFLPHRARITTDYLNNVPRPNRPPDAPLGGRWVH